MPNDFELHKVEIGIELDIGAWDLIWHLTLDIGILIDIRIALVSSFAFQGNVPQIILRPFLKNPDKIYYIFLSVGELTGGLYCNY
jgi:hypothetical protein